MRLWVNSCELKQLLDLVEEAEHTSLEQRGGAHHVVYGERGVGKTSLGLVTEELLRGAYVLSSWATCDASDDFSSVWRKVLGEIGLRTARQAIGFGEGVDETIEAASQLLGPGPVTPRAVRGALQQISRQSGVAIFIERVRPLPGSRRSRALRRHDHGPLGPARARDGRPDRGRRQRRRADP